MYTNMATPLKSAASTWWAAGNGAYIPAKVHKLVYYENGMHDETIYYCWHWAIEKSISEFDDSKGVLLVLIINEFGEMNLNWKKREKLWKQHYLLWRPESVVVSEQELNS